jgi:hypothetical protein
MAVPTSYLTTTKNTGRILTALQKAAVPERFTNEFLQKQLGFTSSSDRPILGVLKALRFLDDSGAPLERYRRYKDPATAPGVLAEALRDAYADIFAGDQEANKLSVAALTGMFARISGKGDDISAKMARTFKTLAESANFDVPGPASAQPAEIESSETPVGESLEESRDQQLAGAALRLHHDVHIHLPVSDQIAVYDAIFKSMRENLGL